MCRYFFMGLLRLWSVYWTNICASAAIDAGSFVDNINAVTGSDAVYRTFWLASAAADAILID